ncbi:MAG TPA: hypothetical protein VLX92_11990 [Kofleriaceae bacterium]|nr:hypothetical protein [Kofleriaceae bacterium]
MRWCVLVVAVACGNDPPPGSGGARSGSSAARLEPAGVACEQLAFAQSTPVPEASGAGWLEVDGRLVLVAIGDSGNHGAYGLIDPDTGKTLEQGRLPLGDAGDDIEGVAGRGDTLYAITSAGWLRAWKRDRKGFTLIAGPYPIGAVDHSLPRHGGLGDTPPKGDGMVCDAFGVNCGRNYEGLCLAPDAAAPCTGFVASKADGHLYCLFFAEGDQLAVDRTRAIAVDRPGVVADCAFDEAGRLWVADNLFGMSQVVRVDGWRDPPHAQVVKIAQIGIGFPEVLAVRGDTLYRMSDTGGAPSLMAKFRCTPPAR